MIRRLLALHVCLGILCAALVLADDTLADAIKKLQKEKKAEDRATWAKFLRGRSEP